MKLKIIDLLTEKLKEKKNFDKLKNTLAFSPTGLWDIVRILVLTFLILKRKMYLTTDLSTRLSNSVFYI